MKLRTLELHLDLPIHFGKDLPEVDLVTPPPDPEAEETAAENPEEADLASLEPEVIEEVLPELLLFMMLGSAFLRLHTIVERAPRSPLDTEAERGGGGAGCWPRGSSCSSWEWEREEDISIV